MSDTRSAGHMLNSIECNGIIFDSGLAQRLAELLLAAHYGNTEVERQRRLMTIDNGDHWHIEGSWNRDRKIEGKGPFFMSVQKHDGRVTDFGLWGVIHPDARAKAAIEREVRQRTEAGKEPVVPDPHVPGGMLRLINIARGGLIYDAKLARQLGELLLQAHCGEPPLRYRPPLIVAENNGHWQIHIGSNGASSLETTGAFSISIRKYDGRVKVSSDLPLGSTN